MATPVGVVLFLGDRPLPGVFGASHLDTRSMKERPLPGSAYSSGFLFLTSTPHWIDVGQQHPAGVPICKKEEEEAIERQHPVGVPPS